MLKSFLIYVVSLLLFFTLSVTAYADSLSNFDASSDHSISFSNKPLIVGYVEFPPLYDTVNGHPQGMLVDISRHVFQQLNLSYKQLPMPTNRLFSSLKSGLVQVWIGIKVKNLDNDVWIGEQPLHKLTLNVYSLSDPPKITAVTDLINKRIILLMGYNYGGWGEYIRNKANQISFIETKTHNDALRLLKTGRFPYLLNYQAPMLKALASHPLPQIQFQTVESLDIVFNVSKKLENGEELLRLMENTLAQSLAN